MSFRSILVATCLVFALACKQPAADQSPGGRAADPAPSAVGRAAPVVSPEPVPTGPSTVQVQVTGMGYTPSEIRAAAGHPLTLEVTRTEDTACGKIIVIPSEKIERELPVGTPVSITFTPKTSGSIGFACGMDMMRGTIIVSDPS